MYAYTVVASATHPTTALNTVWLVFRSRIRRPAKKRRRERCSRAGTASVAHNRCSLFRVLSEKNARTRARSCAVHRDCGRVTLTYLRAHCCNKVASKALVRLMAKLENQSEFTQIAYLGGEKGGGLSTLEGSDAGDPFVSARS